MERFVDLYRDLSPARRKAMAFLAAHLPESDLAGYDPGLFLQFADHALALRETAPWCAELDEEIFYHYVLFPRVNDEDLSFHREIFRAALWDRVAHLPTTEEMVLEVNRWCAENASYQMQDDRTASPLTVWRCGSGRCGEESAFLVSALRSVGIPARQVYAPRWAHCDDNHAWVEALCGRQWRFLGACEPEPVLDRGWFNAPASRALLVHSRLFGSACHPLHGEPLGTEGAVTWYNQTGRYALTRRVTLRAEVDGGGAAGAVFQIQVLNEAGFHTIAALTGDGQGEASLSLGQGDFHVFAGLGELCAEGDVRDGNLLTLSLQSIPGGDTGWQDVDYMAPKDAPVNSSVLSWEQKRSRAAVLAACREKREERIAAMLPADMKTDPRTDLLRAARGNAGEIAAFLGRDGDPLREKLLGTLTEKDLRDVTAETLESHLKNAPPQGGLPEEIYLPFALSPRIELERITSWREPLAQAFSHGEREQYRADPSALWAALRRRIAPPDGNTYANLVLTPLEAWQAQCCDERSLRVLFVALLRAMGVPARLRMADGVPEYWQNNLWRCVDGDPCATLTVLGGEQAVYRRDWTLSRREANGWAILQTAPSCLPEGQYRLITSVRMPNGNQFSSRRSFMLCSGEKKTVELRLRSYALEDLLGRTSLGVMSAVTLDGKTVNDLCRMNEKPSLLLWLEEGGEPTEHILVELAEMGEIWRAMPLNIIFLLRGKDSAEHPTVAAARRAIPNAVLLLDDWAFDLEQTARQLTCDPDTPPLAVLCDRDGNAVYGVSGYSVGAVNLLQRIADHLAKQEY